MDIIPEFPIGEDTRPKDRIKQGISSSTAIEEWDCTKPKDLISFIIEVEGNVKRFVAVQAANIEEADAMAIEEFKALVGADEASIIADATTAFAATYAAAEALEAIEAKIAEPKEQDND